MIVTWWETVGVFPKQEGSQLQREFEFEYSIYPHEGNWEQGNVYAESEKINTPFSSYQITQHNMGYLPPRSAFVSIQPENLILSAFKKAEDRDTYIMRLFNPASRDIEGEIGLFIPFKTAYLTDMNEGRKSRLQVNDRNTVLITVGVSKIVTLEFEI